MSLTPKLDVLKRYKTKDKKTKVKSKNTKNNKNCNLRLVVSSDDIVSGNPNSVFDNISIDGDLDDGFGEDAPIVAEIIDDRPAHLKLADDLFETRKWRAIEAPGRSHSNRDDGLTKVGADPIFDPLSHCGKVKGSMKIEIGERLSKSKLKAAVMAANYSKLISRVDNDCSKNSEAHPRDTIESFRVNATPRDESLGVANDVDATPRERLTVDPGATSWDNRESDSDSDLSLERPPDDSIRAIGLTSASRRAWQTSVKFTPSTISTSYSRNPATVSGEMGQERIDRYKDWGKGLVQVRESVAASQKLSDISGQPLARYNDDPELEKMLRAQKREGDPMAKFLEPRTVQSGDAVELSSRRRCKYASTPNRFGIEPGCRWDGVDRSNGFEVKIINAKAGQLSTAEHAYKWRVEDM